MSLQNLVLACLLVGGLSGGLSGWYFHGAGRTAERAEWLEAERERADTVAELARITAAAELQRSSESERAAIDAVSRAQGVKRESTVVDRPGGEWVDAERLRLQRLHEAYFGPDAPGSAGGLPGGLRTPAAADRPADGLGGTDHGLGLRLPAPRQ